MPAEKLDFEDNTFDIVFMIEVIEHLEDDKKAISEVKRVLKPSGKFVLTAPNKLFPLETHGFRIKDKIYGTAGIGFPILPYLPEFIRKYVANATVYTPLKIKDLLNKEGLKINKINYLGPSLDVMGESNTMFKNINHQMLKFIDFSEKIPILRNFLTTIIIISEKVE